MAAKDGGGGGEYKKKRRSKSIFLRRVIQGPGDSKPGLPRIFTNRTVTGTGRGACGEDKQKGVLDLSKHFIPEAQHERRTTGSDNVLTLPFMSF